MEKRIICPVCNAEKMCIEESQGDLISYMCFRCGYMSDGRMGEDSEFMEKHLKKWENLHFFWNLEEKHWFSSKKMFKTVKINEKAF